MSVRGHPEIGNPKDVTQQNSTSPQRTCLIGICKEMISSMDPLREARLQGMAAKSSLATRKYSSSIFCWKTLHNFQEGKSKNTKCKPWLQKVGASGKSSYPPLIAAWALLEDNPWRYSYSDHKRNNADSLHSEPSREQIVKR